MKKQYYAVVRGRNPGIYTHWTGTDGAEAQVSGFPGAKYKGFATLGEAESYLKSGGALPAPAVLPGEGASPARPSAPAKELPEGWDDYKKELAEGKVVIFTDGASTGNPGPGGYGVVLLFGSSRKELAGGFRCTTNNRMEMLAMITALQSLTRRAKVAIYSDSKYVIDAIEKGWAKRWKARGWMRDSVNYAENSDLWQVLLELLDQHEVNLHWVKGHASHPENERCDWLAVNAAHKPNLPEDAGYSGRCR